MSEQRNRSAVVSVRFSQDELAAVEKLAAERGLLISTYLREHALRKTEWQPCDLCGQPIHDLEYRTAADRVQLWTGEQKRITRFAHEGCVSAAVAPL